MTVWAEIDIFYRYRHIFLFLMSLFSNVAIHIYVHAISIVSELLNAPFSIMEIIDSVYL